MCVPLETDESSRAFGGVDEYFVQRQKLIFKGKNGYRMSRTIHAHSPCWDSKMKPRLMLMAGGGKLNTSSVDS